MTSQTYTLTEATDLLETDPKSLRRWIELEEWDLSTQTSKYDKRVKWLTEAQVAKLAKLHQRAWPPIARPDREQGQGEQGATGAIKLLKEQMATLQANQLDPVQTEIRLVSLESGLNNLQRNYNDLLARFTDVLIQLKELQDWKTAQEARKPGRKPRAQGEAQAQGED